MKTSNLIKLVLVAGIVFAINRPPVSLMAGAHMSDAEAELLSPTSRECMIGEVTMFAGNFAPRSWALCQGQLVAISQNQALFSILGTMYGGDGRTTFALPDLRGRAPIGAGNGPGLSGVQIGARFGQETVTLSQRNIPSHSHNASVALNGASSRKNSSGSAQSSDKLSKVGTIMATDQAGTQPLRKDAGRVTVDAAGGGESFSVRNPGLGINYIICMQGVYPSRS